MIILSRISIEVLFFYQIYRPVKYFYRPVNGKKFLEPELKLCFFKNKWSEVGNNYFCISKKLACIFFILHDYFWQKLRLLDDQKHSPITHKSLTQCELCYRFFPISNCARMTYNRKLHFNFTITSNSNIEVYIIACLRCYQNDWLLTH